MAVVGVCARVCTVTAFNLRDSEGKRLFRVACNRDEQRIRPPSLPPRVREFNGCRAVTPIDQPSGGTWIAANQRGVILVLLNANPSPDMEIPTNVWRRKSRGIIIPSLIDAADVGQIADRIAAGAISARSHPPFRLIAMDGRGYVEARSDALRLRLTDCRQNDSPLFFTSSGLGDQVVDRPRRGLFLEMFRACEPASPSRQDEFHRHQWPDRQDLSVRMSRDDAQTVSYSVVELADREVVMHYQLGGPSADTPYESTTLERV
ncbi:MAG: NRDE family protein [Planctomycetes bacterium]|nr:NRDE family protein [Planctomycetota bacterium]